MKKKIFVMALLASLLMPVVAEDYNDIVVYIAKRSTESQLRNFQNAIQNARICKESYLSKLSDGNWCLIVKIADRTFRPIEFLEYYITVNGALLSKQVYKYKTSRSEWTYYNNFLPHIN